MALAPVQPDDGSVISQQAPPASPAVSLSPRTAPAATKILLISSDQLISRPVRRAFEREGVLVDDAASGRDGLRTLFERRPDIVVLDLMLHGGWESLERIRQLCDAPVVTLGNSGDESELVRALRAGADVYLARPLSALELLAYTTSLQRRVGTIKRPPQTHYYDDGFLSVDLRAAEARANGKNLHLTPLEMRLLTELIAHPNQTLSADQLLSRVWGDDVLVRERVKIFVGYVRGKFKAVGEEAPIVTQRGFGYRYVVGHA